MRDDSKYTNDQNCSNVKRKKKKKYENCPNEMVQKIFFYN